MIHFLLPYKKFIPIDHVDHIFDVDFHKLYQNGIRVLLIDLDNTLIPYDETLPSEALSTFFASLNSIGFETVIVSNNHYERIKLFADALGVPFVSSAKKPTKLGFKKAIRQVDGLFNKNEILVIGDQLMTDVFGAKRMGYEAILVRPIKKKSEKWYTKINRKIEEKMLMKIKKYAPKSFENLRLGERFYG
jgi:HAD superfamily phosphatase (TIGR01668 family)